MKKDANAPEIPLCVNILRLQSYLLAPDEVMLFDWFVVKQAAFKYQDFHYSQARIEEETRIKRTRQNAIISKFKEMGFLSSEVRINRMTRGRVNYYHVDYEILSDPFVLGDIINPEAPLFKQFTVYLKYLVSEQKNVQKQQEKEEIDTNTSEEIYTKLCEVYKERIGMYNEGELTEKKPKSIKSYVKLPRNKSIDHKLLILASFYDMDTIRDSFIAYIDAVLKQKVTPDSLMYYFLTYDNTNRSFIVFEKYLNYFMMNYSRTRN